MDQLIRDLIHSGGFNCTCGRHHSAELKDLILESGALRKIPDLMKRFGGSNLFILTDCNAYAAAGKTVCALLEDAEIPYTLYIFPRCIWSRTNRPWVPLQCTLMYAAM